VGGIQTDVHKYLTSFEAPYGVQESSIGLEGLTHTKNDVLPVEQSISITSSACIANGGDYVEKSAF